MHDCGKSILETPLAVGNGTRLRAFSCFLSIFGKGTGGISGGRRGHMADIQRSLGICLLAIHHTRKLKAEDSCDRISGTNGLLGAA